jgi:hypothetical protein
MLYGHNTKIFQDQLPLEKASAIYPRWYAVVLDPERQNTTLVSGRVAAVSKTQDGAFRALYSLGPFERKVTVARLS